MGKDARFKAMIIPDDPTFALEQHIEQGIEREQPAYPSTIYCYVSRMHVGSFKLAAWKFAWRQGKKRIIRKDKSGYLCQACITEMNAFVFPERK